MKYRLSSSIVIAVLFLSSCGKPAIQVFEEDSKTISSNETIHMNNCGGKESTEQTAQQLFATQLELNPQSQAGYTALENMVAGKYGLSKDTSRSQLLKAPPGTNMEFVLTWSKEEHTGTVHEGTAVSNYVVHIPVAVELVSSRDLGCGIATEDTTQSNGYISETLTISFQDGATGVTTEHRYSGDVTILVQGTGQASSTAWSDAFYVFTDGEGKSIEPNHPTGLYNFTLWINGEPADTLVDPIPPFNADHVYQFTIHAPGGRLVFAVGDVYTVDNAGYYTIQILK